MSAGYTLTDLFYLTAAKLINMKVRNRLKRRYFLFVCLLSMIGLVISGCDGKDMRSVNKTLEEATKKQSRRQLRKIRVQRRLRNMML